MPGEIAICGIPGRGGNYAQDMNYVAEWKPNILISMVENSELEAVDATSLQADCEYLGIAHYAFPVVDFGAPDELEPNVWSEVSNMAIMGLLSGGKVLIHCFGGQGRSGMAALRIMIDMGQDAVGALVRLRAARPGAVETDDQMRWATRSAISTKG